MIYFQQAFIIVFLINLMLASVLIFLERRNVVSTWAWLMVLLFLPGIGFLLYLFLGQTLKGRKLYKLKQGEFSHYQTTIEGQKNMLASGQLSFRDPVMKNYKDLIYMNLVSDGALFTQDNEVKIYAEGHSKYEALIQAVKEAKDHIHLLYYIVRKDELGQRLIKELAEKAREGVEVRLLYDAFGSFDLTPRFLRPLVKAGGEVAVFFPSRIPFINTWINFRNHRKLAIIDGKIGFVGGHNIGKEYLGLDKRMGYWRDTHLKLTGSCVNMLQARFFLDWNLSSARRMEELSRYFPKPVSTGNVGLQIVSSGPNSEKQQIKHGILKMVYMARERIFLQSPYFVPDESVLTALKLAAMSGVDVRVMLPGRPDHKLVYWASLSYLGELLGSGVRCFFYEKGFLHAKTLVVDGRIASVGTANIDVRSFSLNFETNAFIYDTETACKLDALFQADLKDCREITLDEYKQRPLFVRFRESVTRLFSPIL